MRERGYRASGLPHNAFVPQRRGNRLDPLTVRMTMQECGLRGDVTIMLRK